MAIRSTVIGLAAVFVACAPSTPTTNPAGGARPGSIESLRPPLGLVPEVTFSGEVAFTIEFTKPAAHAGPRTAELQFRHGEALEFVRAEPLSALDVAGKRLVAQSRPGNEVRLVALSATNLTPIESGPLARLVFKRIGLGATTLELLDRRPFFAPPEADLAIGPLTTMSVRAEGSP